MSRHHAEDRSLQACGAVALWLPDGWSRLAARRVTIPPPFIGSLSVGARAGRGAQARGATWKTGTQVPPALTLIKAVGDSRQMQPYAVEANRNGSVLSW